jgi:hypothetical protein
MQEIVYAPENNEFLQAPSKSNLGAELGRLRNEENINRALAGDE